MYNYFKVTALISVFLPLFAVSVHSQLDKSNYYSFGSKFYTEAVALPSEAGDSVNIDVIFRIVYDFIPFKQVNSGNYEALPVAELTAKDTMGIIRKRMVWQDTIITPGYQQTISKTDYIYGYFNFKIPYGKYTLDLQLLNNYSQTLKKSKIVIDYDNDYFNKPIVSQPIFAHTARKDKPGLILPFILNGDISFASQGARVFFAVSYFKKDETFYYSITKTGEDKDDKDWGKGLEINGTAAVIPNKLIYLMPGDNNNNFYYGLKDTKFTLNNLSTGIIEIELPPDLLIPGNYKLSIYSKNKKDTLNFDFGITWEDMPLSLRNTDYAVDLMYYILKDDEFEMMKEGSKKEMFRKLVQYWKAHDPTPITPFNEAMAQYYQRIDYAFFNYQTFSDKDGAKSDRGKIYILYGSPDSVTTKLTEGKSMEIWRYDKFKKEYVFEIIMNGIYKLKKINNI